MLSLFRVVLHNHSRYSRDLVWKNALDLEHVTKLHPRTNAEFHLLGTFPEENEGYEVMIYRTRRKLGFLKLHSFGFRKVVGPHRIIQIEYLPLLNITTALNSLLRESSKPGYETEMVDEVVVQLPHFLRFFAPWLKRSLARHARIQCEQDEPFRERLDVLKQKQIAFPYRRFDAGLFHLLTSHFQET